MPQGQLFTEQRELARDQTGVVLTDADAGDNTLQANQQVTYVWTGATGAINVYLPPLSNVPIGAIFTIFLVDHTANDCVVKQSADVTPGVAFADVTMTADADYLIVQACGIKWVRVEETVGGVVAPL